MPRIDFYVLPDDQARGRALLACRLADKAYQAGKTVYLWAANDLQASELDDLLWTFRQDSFVPHERYPLIGPEGSPVLIGTALPHEVDAHVLINCCLNEMPIAVAQFERVLELVDQQPEVLILSRARFKQYRTLGYMPETHAL